ncbi:MAG: membrane protein insertase YidC [Candidatus Desulfofervidaceae bacterium]|nr:membrane protein insertase YidC [Candidatus Desulfofervidaceae bacterium]MDL1970542.1 membrane protein insertase YidC [Candidatus Desulfofervidaceae bacterium]
MAYRAIAAFVLSMLVILLYDYFFLPKKHIKQTSPPAVAPVQPQQPKEAKVRSTPPVPLKTEKSIFVPTDSGREIVVSTPLYKAILCENGARLKRFILKKYRQTVDPNSPPQDIVFSDNTTFPLGIRFLHSDLPLDRVMFKADKTKLDLSSQDREKTITFTANVGGILIEKTFTFYPDDYHIDFNVSFINQSLPPFQDNLVVFLVNKWPEDKKDRYGFQGAILWLNDKFEEVKWKDIKKHEVVKTGKLQWAGLSDKYFMTTIVNQVADKATFIVNNKNGLLVGEFLTPPLEITSQRKTVSFLLYFGPKELDRLKKLDYHLDKAVHFGFFDSIAKLLLYVLKWFYKYSHNYGIAIILLTVVIKILFWPLTHVSFKSMRELQKLQPHIARLKEKYKDDKEALNRELMNLYKTYKVNPMGGCLPIILQIPVFFALYKALLYAIELRHANFITYLPFTDKIWLADLSAKDPYYITPILMGISMMVQQKMTPSTMDPTQSKMMLLMPIFFTFLFLNFPSGLVIYWLVNNLLSIVQQFYINRSIHQDGG